MRRIAPTILLLALAACASGAPPAPPPAVAARPTVASPPTVAPAHDQGFDAMLRTLAEKAPRSAAQIGATPQSRNRPVVYTIAPVPPEIAAQVEQEAVAAEYELNLAGCLDGRFPAFCDHARLTPFDAARARQAEFEANLTTCIDPEWQHLCNPGLLPETYAPSDGNIREPEAFVRERLQDVVQAATPISPPTRTARPPPPSVQPAVVRPVVPVWQPVVVPPPRYAPGCSESGSCYGDISTLTGRPKITYVRGYFRRDGTYVRSYYRSRGRR